MPFDGDVKQYERVRTPFDDQLTGAQKLDLLLTNAAQLIQRGWCRQHEARDERGAPVSPLSREAVRFCSVGALRRAQHALDYGDNFFEKGLTLLERVVEDDVPGWNDSRSRKQPVLNAFERARARI